MHWDRHRNTRTQPSIAQIGRRALQLGVVVAIVYAALGGPWRNYKVAHNSARLVALMHGDTWGELYHLNEVGLAAFGDPYQQSLAFLGIPWAMRAAGIDGADPIMVLAHAASTGTTTTAMLLGVLLPLTLALLLGKVFCSHACPMRLVFEIGHMVRRGCARLGIDFPAWRHPVRWGGWVLLGGLLATAIAGTGVWFFILPYLALSVGIFTYAATAAVTAVVGVAGFWLFIDMFAAPGYFCHNVCPTGFVLEQVGRRSLLKLRKRGPEPCPDKCNQCQWACPYGLAPKVATHRPACDNCGRCAAVCPSRRLGRRISLPVLVALIVVAIPRIAVAHHNKGLPHYGYFANYPQVPTEEYVAIQGNWEIGATIFNFQGLDRRTADTPNDVKIYAYLYDLSADAAYRGAADFEIRRGGHTISRFARLQVDEEAVYSTRETLPEGGDYDLVAIVGGTEVVLPFYVAIAADGVSWLLVVGMAVPVALVFVLAYLGRGRKKRSPHRSRAAKNAAAVLAALLCGAGFADTARASEFPVASAAAVTSAAVAASESAVTSEAVAASESAVSSEAVAASGSAVTSAAVAASESAVSSEAVAASGSAVTSAAAAARDSAGHTGAGEPRTGQVCPHCGMIDCTMDHVDTATGAVMVMGGIPLWLFLTGVAGILLLTFAGTARLASSVPTGFRYNLLANPAIYALVRNRWFQALPQLIMVALLGALVYVGLFGSRVANLTPVAVWTLWWGGLIFAVLFLGSAWCFACPWDGLANLLSRLRVAARVQPLSLGLRFPRGLSNVYVAIALFALLTWLELGFGVTTNPRWTAYMGLAMAALAIVFALLFDGKKFCAHACPVGRICGIYSSFAPIEIRPRKPRICQTCRTEDCRYGNEHGYPCPTGISLKTIANSIQCTMCTECVKSCKKRNVAVNVRPFGADLRRIDKQPRLDEAWLALILLTLTLFHGLTMTPAWHDVRPGQASLLKWMAVNLGTSHTINFTVAMVVICALPVALYWLSCRIGATLTGHRVPTRVLFVHWAYALLPVALFYHLAHNLMHLLMEGGQVVPLLSDPMGTGANYLGTAGVHVGHLVPENVMWFMQVGLIAIGHIFGIVVAHRIGHRLYQNPRAVTLGSLPMLALMIAISVGGLYLMHLDMNMRVGRM